MNSKSRNENRITVKRIAQVGIAALATLGALLLTLPTRTFLPPANLVAEDWSHIIPHEVALGLRIQALIVPLVLIYLLSRTVLFQRTATGSTLAGDRLKMAIAFALIQLISMVYEFSQGAPDRTTFGLFVVVAGALLGGWKLSVGLGLLATLVGGSLPYFTITGGATLVHALALPLTLDAPAWRVWQEALNIFAHDLFFVYAFEMRVLMVTWAGIIAGIAADWIGERRLAPAVAFTFGATVEFSSGLFIARTVPMLPDFLGLLLASTVLTGMAAAGVVLIVRSVQAEETRARAAEAELALARAELRALRAQIKPHFLFNALNTIRYFVRTDPDAARQLLLDLSEVFQRAIRSGEFVTLREELSCVHAYLSLERARLGERLQVTWAGQVTEPQRLHEIESPLLDQMVPTLSIQPIVENAVIHGVSKKPEGGHIRITVERIDEDISIRIEDDGKGIEPEKLAEILKPAVVGDTSIGLRNVDGRLRATYGQDYRLQIQSQVTQGTCITIRIPVGRN